VGPQLVQRSVTRGACNVPPGVNWGSVEGIVAPGRWGGPETGLLETFGHPPQREIPWCAAGDSVCIVKGSYAGVRDSPCTLKSRLNLPSSIWAMSVSAATQRALDLANLLKMFKGGRTLECLGYVGIALVVLRQLAAKDHPAESASDID
jgi:hypothetical protein